MDGECWGCASLGSSWVHTCCMRWPGGLGCSLLAVTCHGKCCGTFEITVHEAIACVRCGEDSNRHFIVMKHKQHKSHDINLLTYITTKLKEREEVRESKSDGLFSKCLWWPELGLIPKLECKNSILVSHTCARNLTPGATIAVSQGLHQQKSWSQKSEAGVEPRDLRVGCRCLNC